MRKAVSGGHVGEVGEKLSIFSADLHSLTQKISSAEAQGRREEK